MAFSLGGSGGGMRGRRRFGGSNGTLSEINIVPLVDVVLVLLIIFMLTAHVMDYGLEIEVPKTKITKENNEVLPVLTLDRSQKLQLNGKPVNINDLPAQLAKRFKDQKSVYVVADGSTRWDIMAQILVALNAAHITPRMVTKPIESRGQ
ncbi:MAG TPA: biopolymer transporter ExbD [Bryobacteraceae bacterium]|jgi:biopolymer transport protein ExbD|nr:biopolymer transporter ExbD [Bryobacteraceae bacterium]